MLKLKLIRVLTLAEPSRRDRPAYISAASGLVHVGGKYFVIADDEDFLAVFPPNADEPGVLKRVFEGNLPLSQRERKMTKADLEVVTLMPVSTEYRNGALLALGSGSTDQRMRAAIIAFNAAGELEDKVDVLDLSFAYHQIAQRVPDLNIEGAVISGEDIVLFQRGNNISYNAMIRCRVSLFLAPTSSEMQPLNFFLRRYDLGEMDGVPLSFTDAAALPDGTIVFSAAAEDTSDPYKDGACKGSAVGFINRNGELSRVIPVDRPVKIEGISAVLVDHATHLMMVTDADDFLIPAELYSAVVT